MDLHPLVNSGASVIEFRLLRQGCLVRIDVPRETVSRRFRVPDTEYGLLQTYEAHREAIDAAVIHRADEGGAGVLTIRPVDL